MVCYDILMAVPSLTAREVLDQLMYAEQVPKITPGLWVRYICVWRVHVLACLCACLCVRARTCAWIRYSVSVRSPIFSVHHVFPKEIFVLSCVNQNIVFSYVHPILCVHQKLC